jgi:hypothetical protein
MTPHGEWTGQEVLSGQYARAGKQAIVDLEVVVPARPVGDDVAEDDRDGLPRPEVDDMASTLTVLFSSTTWGVLD